MQTRLFAVLATSLFLFDPGLGRRHSVQLRGEVRDPERRNGRRRWPSRLINVGTNAAWTDGDNVGAVYSLPGGPARSQYTTQGGERGVQDVHAAPTSRSRCS